MKKQIIPLLINPQLIQSLSINDQKALFGGKTSTKTAKKKNTIIITEDDVLL